MKRVTIHDIAKQAEVSIATVSRVLNNNPRVEPKTAARVRRVIARTGYIPDNIARGMRSRQSWAVGYIVSDISNVHFTFASKALEETLAAVGYSLIVCSTDGDSDREKQYLQLMLAKKIDGLVINVSGHNDDYIAELSQKLPIVLQSRKIRSSAFQGDFVGSDAYQGAYELGRYVLAMGHRRIGLIRGPENVSTGHERYSGFMTALREANVELSEDSIFHGDYYEHSGHDGAAFLLNAPCPPTILVSMNNTMGLGVLAYLKDHGYRVPEDVSCASFGNIANRNLLYVTPAAIGEKPEEEGKLAGETILRRIADPGATPVTALVPGQLFPGNSILDLRERA